MNSINGMVSLLPFGNMPYTEDMTFVRMAECRIPWEVQLLATDPDRPNNSIYRRVWKVCTLPGRLYTHRRTVRVEHECIGYPGSGLVDTNIDSRMR